MLLRLGAAAGARLCSLLHSCSNTDLHQLVTWSKIAFQGSLDVDQARCSSREIIRQNSYLFQVACPGVASGCEKNAAKHPLTSQSFISCLQGLKEFSLGERPACKYGIYSAW